MYVCTVETNQQKKTRNMITQINWKDGTKTYENSKGKIVTESETEKILKDYANEDLNIIIEDGGLAMTDNVYKTVIWFEYENKTFTATNRDGVLMLKTEKKELMRDFIMSCFIID